MVMARWLARIALPGGLVLAAAAGWAGASSAFSQLRDAGAPPVPGATASSTPEAQPPAAAPQASPTPEKAPPSEEPPSQVPPQVESAFLSRTYKVRPGKLWKGLLETLQTAGFPPEEVDNEGRTVKTSFVEFKQDDYQNQVAEPPVRLGGDYHILQMIKVKQGKVSLEGRVATGPHGTELRIRARILVMGLDRVHRISVLVDRRSTGVIEAGFIHKLEARMGLEHL